MTKRNLISIMALFAVILASLVGSASASQPPRSTAHQSGPNGRQHRLVRVRQS